MKVDHAARAPTYSPASPHDAEAIGRLLAGSGLPHDDIGPHLGDFLVAKLDGQLVGVAGVEMHGEAALLRSVAVLADQRGSGIARALCAKALAHAKQRGATDAYLLTTTAADFFSRKFSFARLDRSAAPESIRGTHEFAQACPQTAALLTRPL